MVDPTMAGNGSSDTSELFDEIKQAAQLPTNRSVSSTTNANPLGIPNYEVIKELHRGGQGVVFKAKQLSTNRIVALKLILHGAFATERQRFRFEQEIELASRLNHPNIVTLYDGGVANNQLFYSMEFVQGESLQAFINRSDANNLSKNEIRRRVTLFRKIAEAVGYAHARGVIHRDLKPANVMLDSAMNPKVLDFGLAKVRNDDRETAMSPRTLTGEFVGTLNYASPEQTQADPGLIDCRTDVYSLGVILYEMVTGGMPYAVGGSLTETLDNIVTSEPIRPSSSSSGFDLDLETIMLKALSKDPERRYSNASDLSQDLQRYLNGEAIDARRDSKWYVFKKTISRNRKLVAGLAAFVTLLIVSLVAISIFYFKAVEDRNAATAAKNSEKEQRELEVEQRKLAEFQEYVARIAAADASIRSFATHDTLRSLYRAPERHRSWEYWYVYQRNNLSKLTLGFKDRQQYGHSAHVQSVDYHPNGNWLVSGSWDGTVVLWDSASGEIKSKLELGKKIRKVRFHPSGNQLAVGFFDGDAVLLPFDQEEPELLKNVVATFDSPYSQLFDLAFSPDGTRLLTGTGDYRQGGAATVFDTQSANVIKAIPNEKHPVMSVAWRNDRELAFGDNTIHLFDLTTDKLIRNWNAHENWIVSLEFHPAEDRLISTSYESTAKCWDPDDGQLVYSLHGHSSFVHSTQFSRDGKQLATGSADSTLRIWDAKTGAPISTLWGQYSGIAEVAFHPENQLVASCGTWCTKIWDIVNNDERAFGLEHHNQILDCAVDKDSDYLFTADRKGKVQSFSLVDKKLISVLFEPAQEKPVESLDANQEHVVFGCGNELVVIDRATQDVQRLEKHTGAIKSVALSPKGQFAFSVSSDGSLLRWDLENLSSEVVFESDVSLTWVSTSQCGRWIAVSDTKRVTVFSADSHQVVSEIERSRTYEGDGFDLSFSPDGESLVGSAEGSTAKVWAVQTGELIAELVEHSQPICAVAFSRDGKRIVTSSREGTIKFWDTEYYQVVLTIQGFTGYADTIDFSSNGLKLIGGLYEGSLKIWEAMAIENRPQLQAAE